MAEDPMVGFNLFFRGLLFPTAGQDDRAAQGEPATSKAISHPLAEARVGLRYLHHLVHPQYGAEKVLGIGVTGLSEEGLHGSALHHLASVHHHHSLASLSHHP